MAYYVHVLLRLFVCNYELLYSMKLLYFNVDYSSMEFFAFFSDNFSLVIGISSILFHYQLSSAGDHQQRVVTPARIK